MLGDGAAWVWELGRVNFPSATQILDYCHAREHLTRLAEALAGKDTPAAAKLHKTWEKLLWAGKVPQLLKNARKRALRDARNPPRRKQPAQDSSQARSVQIPVTHPFVPAPGFPLSSLFLSVYS